MKYGVNTKFVSWLLGAKQNGFCITDYFLEISPSKASPSKSQGRSRTKYLKEL